ncbi:hypothetical protein HMPREF0080_01824 [Anaeroglobus geminatus F0357]|uniref:Uncharacterized protein n=1 Tax=Anaeroglobus geminatus F0357 TaxID=861450 RepID=G9YJH3_9FIRM|nr:hypothetical protein HMPREF0080_01824 [Anaeroglobus geminatus F0357]
MNIKNVALRQRFLYYGYFFASLSLISPIPFTMPTDTHMKSAYVINGSTKDKGLLRAVRYCSS